MHRLVGEILGITEKVLSQMQSAQRKSIEPYIVEGKLKIIGKIKTTSTIGKLISEIIKPIEDKYATCEL